MGQDQPGGECTSCATGYGNGDGNGNCALCAPGFGNVEGLCTQCASNTYYSDEVSANACESCPSASEWDCASTPVCTTSSATCSTCATGYTRANGDTGSCPLCAQGYGRNGDACERVCGVGKGNNVGQDQPGGDCTSCATGYKTANNVPNGASNVVCIEDEEDEDNVSEIAENNRWLYIGVGVGALFIVVLVLLIAFFCCRRRKNRRAARDTTNGALATNTIILQDANYAELMMAQAPVDVDGSTEGDYTELDTKVRMAFYYMYLFFFLFYFLFLFVFFLYIMAH